MPFFNLAGAEITSTTSPSNSTVLAEVDGAKLTLGDLERKNPTLFFSARNAFYDAQRKAIQQSIDEYLLERQAQKEGLTIEQLLKKHLDGSIPKDPSEETLRVFYEGVDTKESYEAVRPQILQALRERRLGKARIAYMDSLRNQAKIAMRLAPPRAPLDMKQTPLRGPQDAPVVLVEYADYECPYCQQIQPALDKLEAEYKGKLAVGFKDFPLPSHGSAEKASEATHCAEAQGKYWEFHDRLLATKQLARPQLKEHAIALKLDIAAFEKCLDSGENAARIKADMAEAQALGLVGTPSFSINGRFFNAGSNYDELRKVIEDELNATSARSTDTAKR